MGPEASEFERYTTLSIMYEILVNIAKLLAPFMPFISEEMHRNLTGENSVHLKDYPLGDRSLLNDKLVADMVWVRKITEAGHAKRKEARLKLRQPLSKLIYYNYGSPSIGELDTELENIIASELNVKKVEYIKSPVDTLKVELDTEITLELAEEGRARELIRQVQQNRKTQNMTLADKTKIIAPDWPAAFEKEILKSTASVSIEKGPELKVLKV